jgi:single-stranded DNA-binding protein
MAEEKKDNSERVTITGRIGISPAVMETSTGKRILKLPVAVRAEGQVKPKWEQVFFFGERADDVASRVQKGQLITVVGYRKEIEQSRKMPDGKYGKVKIEVIYGAAFSDPNKKKSW